MFGWSLLGRLPRKGWVIAGVVLAVALFSLSAYGYGFGSGKAAATEKAAEKFQAYQDEVLERERAQNLLVAAANKRNTELERAYERRLSDLRSRLARENAEAAARDAAVMASLRAGSDRLRLQVTACSQDRSGGVESATAGTHGTRTADNEGGFQKDAEDRGNWTGGQIGVGDLRGTKFGISAMTYPDLDIVNLTKEDAKAIYRRDWWDNLRMDLLPLVIQYQMFDAAINHGMRSATKMLQRAVKAEDDGVIGPKTLQAVDNADQDDLLLSFLAERLEFMTRITTWNRYGKGWARRVAHNLRLGTKDN